MIIREEVAADIAAVRRVELEAFAGSGEADLIDRLRADGDLVLSLVAEDGSAIVGHLALSRMAAPFRALGLGPVAVLPAHQRSGVGRGLIAEGLARASSAGWEGVFVLGEPGYYCRFGFSAEAAAGFLSPYSGPYLMALPLLAPQLPATTGRIDYAPAFAAL